MVVGPNPDRDGDLARCAIDKGNEVPGQLPGVYRRCGEVLGFEDGHGEPVHGARRVSKKVDAPWIDRVLHTKHFDEGIQEIGAILAHVPALAGHRIRRGEDDPVLLCKRCPRVHQRSTVAPGAVEQHEERRKPILRCRLRHKQVVRAGLAARTEGFL